MTRVRAFLSALRGFMRGFVGAMKLGADPRHSLCEHGERRGRCC